MTESTERMGAGALWISFIRGLPTEAWLAAVFAAALHMLPIWLAQVGTPDGWSFTGIASASPDLMQYRVWMHQTGTEGVVVSDLLTSEPNRPFLPVVLYWIVGGIARLTGSAPEYVYQYLGCGLAAGLVLVIFGTVRHFLADVTETGRRTVFWVTVLGGGVGGYIKLLEDVPILYNIDTVRRLFVDPTGVVPIFEDYRQHYVITSLFDTHFLMIWLMALISALALYAGLSRGRVPWALVTALLWAWTSLVHVYTGVTLSAVAVCVLLLFWAKGWVEKRMVLQVAASVGAVGSMAVWMLLLQRRSGIPMPSWNEPVIALSTVVLAYPLQLAVVAWGLGVLWKAADRDDVFLLGWALGCLLLTLSTPFYPYPSRGTMTLIIPLTALAGLVYFRRSVGLGRVALVAILLLTVSTPAWRLRRVPVQGGFRDNAPYEFLSTDHQRVTEALWASSGSDDLLLTTPDDALWLSPYHRGPNYAAHFFLTVDYDAKVERVSDFLAMAPTEVDRFLEEEGVDYFWVDAEDDPGRFGVIARVHTVVETDVGTLFRFDGGGDPAGARVSVRANSAEDPT